MSNITSAGVSRRFEGHFAISGQALTRAQPVAERLVQRLARALQEGETMPDIAFVQTLVARTIGILNAELEDSDNQRKHFRSVDRHRRDVMTKAGNKLRFALADVRYILDRTLSKETARAVFEGRSNLTRLVSPVLERVSGRLVTLLADPKFDWEALPDAGYRTTLDAGQMHKRLAPLRPAPLRPAMYKHLAPLRPHRFAAIGCRHVQAPGTASRPLAAVGPLGWVADSGRPATSDFFACNG